MLRHAGTALLVVVLLVACSSSASSDGGLQSSCVRDQLNLKRDLADGEECKNVGYSDCGSGLASDCVHYCAFDVCQSKTCASDADCPGFCKELVVGTTSYGTWCDGKACTHGTMGCPCDAGACSAPDSGYTVTCNAKGVCEGTDTCRAGCRVKGSATGGTICCGAGFCSGSCVGTPCCS
jgi:hypothetical protein